MLQPLRTGVSIAVCGALVSAKSSVGDLGRLVGFEPTTSAATERRSATEL
jgi:hypothetical protein